MEIVSFVIPCYRSEKTIENVVSEITQQFLQTEKYDFEIILVNDFSPDKVWEKIQTMCEKDHRIKGLSLSKNFGQASAVMAGYSVASGDYVITCDDDGQSPIDSTFQIIDYLIENDYDVVYGICHEAKFGLFRKLGSALNSVMARMMFQRPRNVRIISFSVIKRYIIKEVCKYSHAFPYMSGLVHRSTKRIGYYPVVHRERSLGKSGYTLKKLISVWINGFTAFSVGPLHIANYLGLLSACMGVLGGLYIFIRKIINPEMASGWASTVCILLFLGGLILLVLGLIGEYVGRIYMCINQMPQYIIRESKNIKNNIIGGRG